MICTYSKPSCFIPQTDVMVNYLKLYQEKQDGVLVIMMPAKSLKGVLIRVPITVTNTRIKSQVGEERIYLAYISTLMLITEGSPDRNLSKAGS